jgi:predicted LPLAT superfamily acyltransferase
VNKPDMHWAQIGEAGFVGGMRFLLWAHRRLGRLGDWPFRALLFVVMLWFFAVRRLARRSSLEYLRRLHRASGGQTPAPTWRNSFRHFMCFAETILDKLLAFSGGLDNIPFHIEGMAHVLPLLQENRGALLVTAHLGNLELCRRLRCRLPPECPPPRLTVLVHTRHAEGFNRMLQRLDPTQDVELLQVTSLTPATAMRLAERVAAGNFVVIAGDRVPVTPGATSTLATPFLDEPAHFPIGPYVLAAALGCPVFMLFSARRGADFFVTLRPLAERIILPRRDRHAAIRPHLAAYADALAEECRKNPLQWFNFFPFWASPLPQDHPDCVPARPSKRA